MPARPVPPVIKPCAMCGQLFSRRPCDARRTKYCSGPCRWKANPPPRKPVRSLEERFWANVDKSGPIIRPELGQCWVWTAGTIASGYGCVFVGRHRRRKQETAHRVAWELGHGVAPAELWVLHKCDNPPCVRPDHLFLGTPSDNSKDCASKGRLNSQVRKRERQSA